MSTNSHTRSNAGDGGHERRPPTPPVTFSVPHLNIKDAVLPLQRGKEYHAVEIDEPQVARLRALAPAD